MARVITFGEIMLRLNPEGYRRIVQADTFAASYAGGEANVAVSLAQYGDESYFVSKVPMHEVGQACINSLRKYGVHTDYVIRGGERLGIYYVEKGASQRPSKVIYDRAHSAIALSTSDEYPWHEVFMGADWFHWTGITPAISDNLPDICLEACRAARERGVNISCDLNYRKKLWSKEKAKDVMKRLIPYVDLCIANEEDAADVFGITAEGTDIESGQLSKEGYISVAKQICDIYGCKKVAITLRSSLSASVNKWAGMLYDGQKAYFSKEYTINIVDRVGGGDSFGGALIHALLKGMDPQTSIEFAVAASCLKHTIEEDYNLISEQEVMALMSGNGNGRVQR